MAKPPKRPTKRTALPPLMAFYDAAVRFGGRTGAEEWARRNGLPVPDFDPTEAAADVALIARYLEGRKAIDALTEGAEAAAARLAREAMERRQR